MKQDEAETLALKALGWLATQDEVWSAFVLHTGLDPADIRRAASDTGFLSAVLEFLTQHDGWVTAFCDAAGVDYRLPLAARHCLSPESDLHWT